MTTRNLDRLFRPRSVVLIGATDRPGSVGAQVLDNLLHGGFQGPIWTVNPNRSTVAGLRCYPDVGTLPETPDLAVVCTPPPAVAPAVAALADRGTKAVVILTAGLDREILSDGRTVRQAVLDAARPKLLRILGPNCVGLLVPDVGLNASFAHVPAEAGGIAFVSQSGALCTVVLDWARSRSIGFSHFISLGDSIDVDFGDVIDYLAGDPRTRSIMLYVESVKQARKFLSASRAAARNKPIVAIKVGRSAEGARAATTHTGALAGNDDVFSAAFRRAGIVRVEGIEELFEAVETLARLKPPMGDRLAILTNGGGPGVIAVDALIGRGGCLAELSPGSMKRLDEFLPATWSRGNPIDIIGDADQERFARALKVLLDDPGVDAVLSLYSPTAIVSALDTARAVIATAAGSPKPQLVSWLGGDTVAAARRAFVAAGLPSYDSPESAVRAFSRLIEYRRSQEALMETPSALAAGFIVATEAARAAVTAVLAEGRREMTGPESKTVLAAYGLPFAQSVAVPDVDGAVRAADALGYPVAVKILSPDISHKSDHGGVALGLKDGGEVRRAGDAMLVRLAASLPKARLAGLTVERMIDRPKAYELLIGAATDPIFGPVLMFGQGGTAVEVVADRAVALPPLNAALARELILRTRISRRLVGYRNEPPVDMEALAGAIVRVSQLIADIPEIAELDINPLLADRDGIVALDARIRLQEAPACGADRLAIRPYPQDLEEEALLADGRRLFLRPIRPEDEPAHRRFVDRLSPEDRRFRFAATVKDISHSQLARLTQIDYDREMAFIATSVPGSATVDILGIVRAITDPDNETAEFAVVVDASVRGRGLGRILLDKIIRYCRARGTVRLIGQVSPDNVAMRGLGRSLGFSERGRSAGDPVEMELDLRR